MVRFTVGLRRSYVVLFLAMLIAMASLVASVSVSADPGNGNDPIGPVLAKLSPATRKLIVRGPDNTFYISAQVADKEAVMKEIRQAFDSSKKAPSQVQPMCGGSLCGDHSGQGTGATYVSPYNGYIHTNNYFHTVLGDVSWSQVQLTADGNQSSYWSNYYPATADSLVLGNSVTADVQNGSISWGLPPSYTLNQSTNTATYTGQTTYNVWQGSYAYSNLQVRAGSIPSAHQSDSGTFQFGSNFYTSNATVWLP